MYYMVGRWQDFVFMLDSSDNSCEIVRTKSLVESGVVWQMAPQMKCTLDKLRMLYNFNSRSYSGSFERNIVRYDIKVINRFSDIIKAKMCLGIKIISKKLLFGCNEEEDYSSVGYDSDYVVFLEVFSENLMVAGSRNGLISEIHSDTVTAGCPIPINMIEYIVNGIMVSEDFNKLRLAFLDSFVDGIILNSLAPMSDEDRRKGRDVYRAESYYDISDIVWG